ncbi:MAG: hypothetical protein EHM57_00205 [Actinobacteria bacterium]|nr:MAG: hypothetical protein EHM57_00205 [Actinomycetota bacterium]
MHEAALVGNLVRQAERIVATEKAGRATELVLTQGRLGHISVEHLRAHFDIVAAGTAVAGANLVVRTEGEGEDLRLVSVTVEDL